MESKKEETNRLDYIYCFQCKKPTDSILLKSGQRTCRICGMGKRISKRGGKVSLKSFIKYTIIIIFAAIGVLWFLGWIINTVTNWITRL